MVVHGVVFYTVKRTKKPKKSNLRERNLPWNKFIRRRDRIRLLLWKLQRNWYNKNGVRGIFPLRLKNEETKKKFTFWTPLLFKHIWSSNLVFFLYMGNTVKVNLQEWEGTVNCQLIPLMHTQERGNDLAWCKKSLSVYI